MCKRLTADYESVFFIVEPVQLFRLLRLNFREDRGKVGVFQLPNVRHAAFVSRSGPKREPEVTPMNAQDEGIAPSPYEFSRLGQSVPILLRNDFALVRGKETPRRINGNDKANVVRRGLA
jgi:hypothetical protein